MNAGVEGEFRARCDDISLRLRIVQVVNLMSLSLQVYDITVAAVRKRSVGVVNDIASHFLTMLSGRLPWVRVSLCTLLCAPSLLYAQAQTTTNPWSQRLWLFVGLGQGSIKESVAWTFGGSYSAGPLIFTLRQSGATELNREGISETAFLAGVRSGGARSFVSAQLGPSVAHRYHSCDCSSADSSEPTHGALAFDVAAQANWVVPGIGFDLFGDLFPSSHRYVGLAVMVQLGWFGSERPSAADR